jgi:SAM-dependent methyltransferase
VAAPAPVATRICPLLERQTATRRLPYAPQPWQLLECLESGFVYLGNPPGYDALEQQYAWERTSALATAARRDSEPYLHAASAAYGAFRRRVLRRNKVADLCRAPLAESGAGPIHVLDVGCGDGRLLERVVAGLPSGVARRCVPDGIELSRALAHAAAARLASMGGTCVQASAPDGLARLPEGRFHLILLASYLEHESQPLPVLRRCRALLADSGRVVVKVPNYACWNRRLRGARWCGFRWPDHVNYFTPHTLRAMAARAGLHVARMRFRDRHPLSDSLYAVLAARPD